MIPSILFLGILLVSGLLSYGRWLDDETLADVCWYALVIEFAVATLTYSYTGLTDAVFFLNLGATVSLPYLFQLTMAFTFDGLSGFFFGILSFALIICYYFLIEYFEYDLNGSAIILLSALFSQVAL